MIASERFSDQQNQQKFIVKNRFYWRENSVIFVTICESNNYEKYLKIRKIESNIGADSENRRENGGKMSVYSTK